MAKFYAGIGSRETPLVYQNAMTQIAMRLQEKGYTLRSGAADGADAAFERGAGEDKEIYLPWKGFNDHPSDLHKISFDALILAQRYHKGWAKLSHGAHNLMARNCYQVLGYDLKTPSDFVVCWTADGCEKSSERSSKTGGTGQAIDIADSNGLPVFNLQRKDALERLKAFLREKEGAR